MKNSMTNDKEAGTKKINKVTMFALANALTKSGNALWRFRTSSRKANHCGVFHSFLSKKLVR